MNKLFAIILILSSSIAVAVSRQQISLNGTWQGMKGKDIAELPTAGWEDIIVPGKTDSYGVGGAAYLWVKRQIDIPQDWQNSRIFVKFGGAGYGANAYIDGKLVGQALDGWTPFEIEITSVAKPGTKCELQLRCQDKTALYPEGFVYEPNQPEDALRGKILAPIGGHTMFFGPWDDIWLISRPNIYIDDITIIPSTRKNTLTITGTISKPADGDLWVEGKVIDNNETALDISASAADANSWQISASFTNAKYWSPESPHLYKLRLTLRNGKDGQVIDTLDERFGFKEFWIEGPDFYLNGVKRHLLASSTWPIGRWVQSYDEVRNALEMIKAGNNNTFRFHTAPWPKRWNDIADEVGLMIVDEAAVYTDSFGMYAYNDERFWNNYREHLKGFIKRDKNNASLIMWSVENEILFMGMERHCPDLAKKLGDMGRFAKQLDPHHPITFEGDLDPDGAADVIGLHYPHELPTFSDWPNTADWLAQRTRTEAGGGMLGVTRRDFYWDRTKPLYIGEYLWVPQEDYSAGTIFFGDDAYTDKLEYHHKAKLAAWIDQSIAYRRMGVSAMCPWSCFDAGVKINGNFEQLYEAQKDFYRPVAAFLQNKDTRFFAGDIVERTFDVFNDSAADCNLSLIWKINDSNQLGRESLFLKAGDYKEVKIKFTAPDVNSSKEFYFQGNLLTDSNLVHTKYAIIKKEDVKKPAGANILIYDPCGTFAKNVPFAKQISSFEELKSADILIIAPQRGAAEEANSVQQIGSSGFDSKSFLSFVESGGKAIILEQNNLSGFGLDITLAKKKSTMTFALNKEHPVLKGISGEDLKFWRGDNYVTSYEIARPASGGARAITVSGGNLGIEHCAIMEQPIGKGNIIFIQALVAAKFDSEPAARKILQNSLDYIAAKESKKIKTVVFGEEGNFKQAFAGIGVKQSVINDINDNNLKSADILVLQGGGEKIIKSKDAIAEFLKAGKTVYWHCPDAKTFDALKIIFSADNFEIVSSSGPVAVNMRENNLLAGISREDLLFVKRERGWQREVFIDPAVIDKTIMPVRAIDDVRAVIKAAKLELKGHKVFPEVNQVKFQTKGTATGWIEISQSGMYDLSLIAGGTSERGNYPLVSIKIGEKIIAQVNLTKDQISEYRFLADLPAGKNKLQINFENGPDWGDGRELLLDSLTVGSIAKIPENIELLTLPAALTCISAGKGKVVIDNVRWENDANNIRGLRYASALFANLGASFEAANKNEITWLALDSFNLVGESPYFEKTNTQISLRNNGTVAAEIYCASQGKYTMLVRGYSTPVNGKYADVEIKIDGKTIGQKEIASRSSSQFEAATVEITAGKHTVSVSFINDAYDNGQDRNFFMDGFGFKAN